MKGRLTYLAVAVVAIVGVLVLAGPAAASKQAHATAATNVACGDTITASVTMDGDLNCSGYSGTALEIAADGVVLDLGGHTIVGNDGYDVIYSDDEANNFTVQNGTIDHGDEQIYIEDTTGATFQNLTLTNAADDAIDTYYDAGTVFANNTCTHPVYYCFYSEDSAGSMVTGNVFTGNVANTDTYGVYLDGYDTGDTFSSNYIRNFSEDGVDDYYSDLNTYSGNIVTGNVGDGFYLEGYSSIYYGSVTMVNNASRVNQDDGWDTSDLFNNSGGDGTFGPTSVFSGNLATYNVIGFDEYYSDGSTWTNNLAQHNSAEGFYFEYPTRETITNNTAKYNGSDGFYFSESSPPYDPLSVANNVASYNSGYGFDAEYPLAGSGLTGTGNSSGMCYIVSGCG